MHVNKILNFTILIISNFWKKKLKTDILQPFKFINPFFSLHHELDQLLKVTIKRHLKSNLFACTT